ncbi:MAG: short-chain dehydrogenase [Acidimicrobiales bacterium]|nr:MAG: short-chain dehydrogenase [Acidimicrobiales bacterium]
MRLAPTGSLWSWGGRDAGRADAVVAEIISNGGTASIALGDVAEAKYGDEAVASAWPLTAGSTSFGQRGRGHHPLRCRRHHRRRVAPDHVHQRGRPVPVQPGCPAGLRATGGGAIVNISSTNGLVGAAGMVAYCASKGAVTNLTRAMALDHAAEGIRINAVCPGAVDTNMLYSERDDSLEEVRSMNLGGIPEGRIPSGDEIAHVVSFLADDRSRHLNGANLSVDGGYTAS